MKIKFVFGIVVLGIVVCLGMNMPFKSNSSKPTLKQIATIDLPGEVGKRFDYLTIDYKHNYLFSAHLGANVLYVIDTKTNKLVKMITDTPGAEGVEYVQELNKVYTSNWKGHTIGVIDMNKMEVIKKIPAIEKPDGNVYASHFKKLYVSDERGKTLIVVDVNKDEVVKKISFKSETGMPQYDSISKKIYLNLQDENIFVVIDPANDSIIGRYTVGECKGNHGMALDVEHRLAFLACEGNDLLTVMNLDTYKPVAFLKMAGGCDVVKYDPGLKRIYVACYDGFISVFHEDDATHFTKLEDFPVQKRVHSLAVDIFTHRVYAPEQEENGKSVSRMIIYEAIQQ
ncbi:MAG TPA: YncE family protein [Bacteroidia bacterium]|nr:YncE family protein [Bacteroidia bacterium]